MDLLSPPLPLTPLAAVMNVAQKSFSIDPETTASRTVSSEDRKASISQAKMWDRLLDELSMKKAHWANAAEVTQKVPESYCPKVHYQGKNLLSKASGGRIDGKDPFIPAKSTQESPVG